MIVACGFDHAGVPLRPRLLALIDYLGHAVLDLGTDSTRASRLSRPGAGRGTGGRLRAGPARHRRVRSGAGVSVAACNLRGIRAATIHDTYTAHQAVEHDNLNVLCLGARVIGPELAAEIVTAFLGAVFSGEERHVRRLANAAEIELTGDAVTTPDEGSGL